MTQDEMAAIYDKYKNTVYRTAFAYCRNRADAEDIMQEVFLRRFAAAKTFEDENSEKAWLLRVSANKCKDLFKSAWRRYNVPLEAAASVAEIPQDNEVYHAVMALPADYRLAVHLFYYEGYSIAEIARIMRKTEAAAAAVLCRARKRLKRMLGEELEL
ncbi:MAG: sigma-70 family RNA polymerase sigma factor [Oscillospiraceae bacterium]|nr:sigma-70 family RNA polymerase sigma factor [Oscillospiraceae bacterium]